MVKPSVSLCTRFLLSVFFVGCAFAGRKAEYLKFEKGEKGTKEYFLFDFKIDNRTEGVYVKNGDFFSGNPLDQYAYAQGTWDFTSHTKFSDFLNSKFTLRNKAKWGGTRGVETTRDTTSLADVKIDEHSHGFNRLVPWIRKAWVKVCLNDALDIDVQSRHYFKFGAFPYQVGRGISLGEAYAVSPGLLGFFADNTIDQYAFGGLLHGEMTEQRYFDYDVYGALLTNSSMSVDQTTEQVYPSQYTNKASLMRGYGVARWILASRLIFTLFDNKNHGRLTAEPYVVYLRDPANTVEFMAGGDVKLGTYGLACEYNGPRFEAGFDTAMNAGRQIVRSWDRNTIVAQRNTTTAAITEVYNNVYTGKFGESGSVRAPVTNANKTVVDSSPAGVDFNDAQIDSSGLYNSPARFRPEYRNLLGGMMFVADAMYWLKPEVLKVAATVGYASGEENPNTVLERPEETEVTDRYNGFVPLQEIYSGKRVRSIFVIGAQFIKRPLTAPSATVTASRQAFASSTTGFTNLVYTGAGLTWTPQHEGRYIRLNPNILYYWQAEATKRYCLACRGSDASGTVDMPASKALGMEINLFGDVHFLNNFRGFIATAVFIPGPHYSQVKGIPINRQQQAEVTRADRVGIDNTRYPLINNKMAYALDLGFEYLF